MIVLNGKRALEEQSFREWTGQMINISYSQMRGNTWDRMSIFLPIMCCRHRMCLIMYERSCLLHFISIPLMPGKRFNELLPALPLGGGDGGAFLFHFQFEGASGEDLVVGDEGTGKRFAVEGD